MYYGSQTWGQGNQSTKNKIQIIQNKAVRKITFSKHDDDVNSIYRNLKILKFVDYLHVQNCLFMHKFETGELPNSFKTKFRYASEKHQHNTRSGQLSLLEILVDPCCCCWSLLLILVDPCWSPCWRSLLEIPTIFTQTFGKLSIKYQCIQDYNNLKKCFLKLLSLNFLTTP